MIEAGNRFYSDAYLNRSGVSPAAIDQQAHVAPALALVDAGRIIDTIEWLQGMGTRYYRSNAGRNASVGLQARWEGYGSGRSDFSVTRFEHPWEQDSVIASIEGTVLPNEIVLIGGHLDSINASNQSDAPGADDNASGIAVVSEVLRVMLASDFRPRRTAAVHGLRGRRGRLARFPRHCAGIRPGWEKRRGGNATGHDGFFGVSPRPVFRHRLREH